MRTAPLDELRAVVDAELRELLGRVVDEAADETVYFFAVIVTGCHVSPFVVANSEQALAERRGLLYAEQGVTDYEIDPWDPGQWRWSLHGARATTLLGILEEKHDAWIAEQPSDESDSWDAVIHRLDEIYLDALQAIDREGLLGPSRATGHAALLLMDESQFDEDEWRAVFRRLNPPEIEARLLRDWGLAT